MKSQTQNIKGDPKGTQIPKKVPKGTHWGTVHYYIVIVSAFPSSASVFKYMFVMGSRTNFLADGLLTFAWMRIIVIEK